MADFHIKQDKELTEIVEDTSVNYSYLPELVGHLLGLAHLRATQLCTQVMDPLALTPKQFVTLEFVSKNPEIAQKDIAHHVGTTPPVMVNILDELSKRKLVCRVRSTQDRRRQFVQTTDAGRRMLGEMREKAFQVEEIFADEMGLSDAERQILLTILRKMTGR